MYFLINRNYHKILESDWLSSSPSVSKDNGLHRKCQSAVTVKSNSGMAFVTVAASVGCL